MKKMSYSARLKLLKLPTFVFGTSVAFEETITFKAKKGER